MSIGPAPLGRGHSGTADRAQRVAAVVIGMHRSGTSALAGALARFGFAPPSDPMPPQPDNPDGFHEPLGMVRLNNRILAELGASWDRPGPFLLPHHALADAMRLLNEALASRWGEEAIAVLRQSFGASGNVVIKDPRLSVLLPFWHVAFAKAGFTPRYALIHRNPLEVAASLQQRNHIGQRRALQLWQTCHHYILDFARTSPPSAVMSYEMLLSDPGRVLGETVADLLDAPAPRPIPEGHPALDCVRPAQRHHIADAASLSATPMVAALVKETYALLNDWDSIPAVERQERSNQLGGRFLDATLYGAPVIPLNRATLATIAPSLVTPAPPPAPFVPARAMTDAPPGERPPPLIFHYHIFKNAGTSVDAMLKLNFGDRWSDAEFPGSVARAGNVDLVRKHLLEHPELDAFSSHTALLPVPDLVHRDVFPIIFLRHPIDRLKSAYLFEKKQTSDEFGAQLAKSTDFAGYLTRLLELPGLSPARNFQTFRFAANFPADSGSERERAARTLETLPFVGMVEAYARSLEQLQSLLRQWLPEFVASVLRRNVTAEKTEPLDQKLATIRAEIGDTLYQRLVAENEDDLMLFETVRKRYQS